MPNVTEREIAENLMQLGFRPDYCGYRYMIEAVKLRMDSPPARTALHKGIYEEIARRYGTTVGRVERGIRYAIETVHIYGNERWHSLFPGEDKPTNGQAIAAIAERHRLRRVS
mgnify:CR=1 FL=1